jgi:hypothetical protein
MGYQFRQADNNVIPQIDQETADTGTNSQRKLATGVFAAVVASKK